MMKVWLLIAIIYDYIIFHLNLVNYIILFYNIIYFMQTAKKMLFDILLINMKIICKKYFY